MFTSKILTVAFLGVALLLGGCDSRLSTCRGMVSYDTVAPAGANASFPSVDEDSLQIHLAYGFEDDHVTIAVGGVTMFSNVVTSDEITAHTGSVISMRRPSRPRRLRVTVNRSDCAHLPLDDEFRYVVVSRESSGDVSVTVTNRAPLFD